MEFDQLRHFTRVAELGNFTKAAAAVGLSQPALSRSIARLEDELGQPVLERQTRRATLTDAGRLLLDRARRILFLVDDAKAEIRDDGRTGRIRVGAIPTIAPYLLPRFLWEFRRSSPDATVIVQEDATEDLLRKLADGEVDVALLARPVKAKHPRIEDLFEEELLLVMSADNPLRAKTRPRMADIESLPFVLLGEAHCLTDQILGFCRHNAVHPVSVERTSQLATVQELVALNHGVSMIPAMARALDSSDRRVYRSMAGARPTRRIVMAWNPDRFQSRLVEEFKQQLRNHAANEPPMAKPTRPTRDH